MFSLLLVVWLGRLVSSAAQDIYDLEDAEAHFEQFLDTYSKTYESEEEQQMRFEIFKNNLVQINEQNRGSDTPNFGITKFSDLSEEEFQSMYANGFKDLANAVRCQNIRTIHTSNFTSSAPAEFDWRSQNVVSPVKNQGQRCQSCFTFSTTGNIESQYYMKHKRMQLFSQQQLLDCGPGSCNGGWMSNSMLYLQQAGGIMAENSYPYVQQKGRCRFDKSKVAAKVVGCTEYKFNSNEEALKEQLYQTGPLSFGLNANPFQHYRGGILQNCSQGRINHAVLLVGYGSENGVPFWTIKNSYGPNWGESGYIRIRRGVNACSMMAPFSHIVSATVA